MSIITTSYNQAKYLPDCIESVLAQTYTDWELLIVDDGSTDNTKEVVSKYQDKRIKSFYLDHTGYYKMPEKYNFALSKATGELIAILEADDYYPHWKLNRQVKAFTDDKVIMAWGRLEAVTEDKKYIQIINTVGGKYDKLTSNQQKRELFFGNFIPFLSVMFRRGCLDEGFQKYPGLHCLDYPTLLSILEKGEFVFIDEILGYWRWHQKNLSKQFKDYELWKDISIHYFNKTTNKFKEEITLTLEEMRTELYHKKTQRFRLLKIRRLYRENIPQRIWRYFYYKGRCKK